MVAAMLAAAVRGEGGEGSRLGKIARVTLRQAKAGARQDRGDPRGIEGAMPDNGLLRKDAA